MTPSHINHSTRADRQPTSHLSSTKHWTLFGHLFCYHTAGWPVHPSTSDSADRDHTSFLTRAEAARRLIVKNIKYSLDPLPSSNLSSTLPPPANQRGQACGLTTLSFLALAFNIACATRDRNIDKQFERPGELQGYSALDPWLWITSRISRMRFFYRSSQSSNSRAMPTYIGHVPSIAMRLPMHTTGRTLMYLKIYVWSAKA